MYNTLWSKVPQSRCIFASVKCTIVYFIMLGPFQTEKYYLRLSPEAFYLGLLHITFTC